jgi:hypothetical protein
MITAFSRMHSNDDDHTSLTLSESDEYYSMNARFGKSRTRDVERYMDSRIGTKSNTSFVNSRINGNLSLNDNTTFYIKKYPGHIKIKLDKDENSYEAYHRIKSMCEGIKDVLK